MKRIVAIFLLLTLGGTISNAQTVNRITPVETACGAIIESEYFTQYDQHVYTVALEPGDRLEVSVVHVGNQLASGIYVADPTNLSVVSSGGVRSLPIEPQPFVNTGVVSARGIYSVYIRNYNSTNNSQGNIWASNPLTGGTGIYTISFRCVSRDGTFIEPGDAVVVPPNADTTTDNNGQTPSVFTGFGFPGLPPVDFSSAFRSSLPLGTDIVAEIPIGGDAILGYTFDGMAGQSLQLNFGRNSGNLNLGLVVLSANNEVAFQTSLINNNSLTTNFSLPSTGQYTIGIFRIELVPIDNPQPTNFRLNGILG